MLTRRLFVLSPMLILLIGLVVLISNRGSPDIVRGGWLFEALVFFPLLLIRPSLDGARIVAISSVGLYILSSFYIASFNQNIHFFDFLLIYKSFVYSAIFLYVSGAGLLTQSVFLRFYQIILAIFWLRYAVLFSFDLSGRPDLFLENNFEIVFLLLLTYLRHVRIGKATLLEQATVLTIVAMSGSLSGAACAVVIFLGIYWTKFSPRVLAGAFLFIGLSAAILAQILDSRLDGRDLLDIDRVKMFYLFVGQMVERGPLTWVFGAPRISTLSPEICSQLSYYQENFSFRANGKCFSAVFHAYLWRAIHDHGILGLIAINSLVAMAFRKACFKWREVLVVLAVANLNGLSVSGFNNVFFALSAVMFLTLQKRTVLGSSGEHLKA